MSRCSRKCRAGRRARSLGAAGVSPRPHLRARPRRRRCARALRVSRQAACPITRRWPRHSSYRAASAAERSTRMRPLHAGQRDRPVAQRREFFPALIAAIDAARREVWIETYIFADDEAGQPHRRCAGARRAARRRRARARRRLGREALPDARARARLRDGGVQLLKYRPEVAPWQFRSHRMRRLHRKLVPRRRRSRVRRRHQHDRRHEHAAAQAAARRFRGARAGAAAVRRSCRRCSGCGRSSSSSQFETQRSAACSRTRSPSRAGRQRRRRSSSIRDNLRHRRDIERAYLAAIRTAQARDPHRQRVFLSRRSASAAR